MGTTPTGSPAKASTGRSPSRTTPSRTCYWGDHQIIYLTKLLELAEDHEPGAVAALPCSAASYADVPYRLRSHADLVKDPRDAVAFDHAADAAAEARVEQHGAVGNFVHNDEGEIVLVNLAEKLLVPVLAKLSALCRAAASG